jgi:hypothetical protein
MPSAKRKRIDGHGHRHGHGDGHGDGHEHDDAHEQHDEHEQEQSTKRRERNRVHAKVSRERKKRNIAHMQRTIDYLRSTLKASVPGETYEQIMRDAPHPTLVATVDASARTKEPLRKKLTPFVNKLRAMLDDVSLKHAIRWNAAGDSIEFEAPELARLLPKYFRSGLVATFQRQLHYHKFVRVSQANEGTLVRYQHAQFTRDRPDTMVNIVRCCTKPRACDRPRAVVDSSRSTNDRTRHCDSQISTNDRVQVQIDQLQAQFEELRDTWLSFTPPPPPPMALPSVEAAPTMNALPCPWSTASSLSELDVAPTTTLTASEQGNAVAEYLECLL